MMRPGDLVTLYSNPTNSMAKSIPSQVKLIEKKGDVQDLWLVQWPSGERSVTFVHEADGQVEQEPDRPKLRLVEKS